MFRLSSMPARAFSFILLCLVATLLYIGCIVIELDLRIFTVLFLFIVAIFWFSQDSINRSIIKHFRHSLPPLQEAELHQAVEALQNSQSINELHGVITRTLQQIYHFGHVEIYYPEYWRNMIDDYKAIPAAYSNKPNQRITTKTATEKSHIEIISTHTCEDKSIKDFLRLAEASALFALYHEDKLLCLIQISDKHYRHINKDLSAPLMDYLHTTLQRILHLQRGSDNQTQQMRLLQSIAGNIAHEIRNPLNILSMILQVVQRQIDQLSEASNQRSKEKLATEIREAIVDGYNTINRSKIIMDIIINNIRSNIKTEHFLPLSIKACTEKALNQYAYQDDEIRQISAKLKDNFIFVGDESLFIFVIYNLLKNALYYISNHPDMTITVYSETGSTYNSLYFTDTGPGIASENLPNLFDDFYSIGKKHGAGLGLPFCKRTMQAFGGDIQCESVVNEYTRFILTFPKINAGSI